MEVDGESIVITEVKGWCTIRRVDAQSEGLTAFINYCMIVE
jgi:hypothetical protein